MKKRKLIIDCDPGVDDAVMLALAAAHQEQLEIMGIRSEEHTSELQSPR